MTGTVKNFKKMLQLVHYGNVMIHSKLVNVTRFDHQSIIIHNILHPVLVLMLDTYMGVMMHHDIKAKQVYL